MWKLLRRLFGLALLAGAGYAAYTAWQRRLEPSPTSPPTSPPTSAPAWPPIDDTPTASTAAGTADEHPAAATVGATDTGPDSPRWVSPVDGACPPGYPIKGNDNSGIYHVPGGRFYERTVPERCYANEDDAQADGYRRAKA